MPRTSPTPINLQRVGGAQEKGDLKADVILLFERIAKYIYINKSLSHICQTFLFFILFLRDGRGAHQLV